MCGRKTFTCSPPSSSLDVVNFNFTLFSCEIELDKFLLALAFAQQTSLTRMHYHYFLSIYFRQKMLKISRSTEDMRVPFCHGK
jgi:hypothetical protein